MYTDDLLRNRAAELSAEERYALEGAIDQVKTYSAGQLVIRQGMPVNTSTLIVKGFMTRHVDFPQGTRQLVAVHVPGDFVDLHAYAFKKLDHDVGALTDVTVAIFRHSELERIQKDDARLTGRLLFLTLLDAAMHRHWIYRLASFTAIQRVSHFLCEMNARLMAIGDSDGRTFILPMTQGDIGEVCSLTNVHVNRVLRKLREAGLCHIRASRVQIADLRQLTSVGLFNPEYLSLNPRTAARAAGNFECSSENSQFCSQA